MKRFDLRDLFKTTPEYVGRFYIKATGRRKASVYDQTTDAHMADVVLTIKTKIKKNGKGKVKPVFKLTRAMVILHLKGLEALSVDIPTARRCLQTVFDFTSVTSEDEKNFCKNIVNDNSDHLPRYCGKLFMGMLKLFYPLDKIENSVYHYFKDSDLLFLQTNRPNYQFSDDDYNETLFMETGAVRYDVHTDLENQNASLTSMDEGFATWTDLQGNGTYIGYVLISPSKQLISIFKAESARFPFMIRPQKFLTSLETLTLPECDQRHVPGHYLDKRYAAMTLNIFHNAIKKDKTVIDVTQSENATSSPLTPVAGLLTDVTVECIDSQDCKSE